MLHAHPNLTQMQSQHIQTYLFVVAYIGRKPELAWNWMIKPSQLFHCGSCVEQHSYCTACYMYVLVTDLLTSYHACISS